MPFCDGIQQSDEVPAPALQSLPYPKVPGGVEQLRDQALLTRKISPGGPGRLGHCNTTQDHVCVHGGKVSHLWDASWQVKRLWTGSWNGFKIMVLRKLMFLCQLLFLQSTEGCSNDGQAGLDVVPLQILRNCKHLELFSAFALKIVIILYSTVSICVFGVFFLCFFLFFFNPKPQCTEIHHLSIPDFDSLFVWFFHCAQASHSSLLLCL